MSEGEGAGEQLDHAMRELAMFRQRVTAVENSNEELRERVDQLEYTVEKLVADLPTQKRSKREKMAAVVRHAVENGTKTPAGRSISKDAAAGAAGCGGRHALNLFDDLEDQFSWAVKRTESGQAKLALDFGSRDAETFVQDVSAAFPEVADERT